MEEFLRVMSREKERGSKALDNIEEVMLSPLTPGSTPGWTPLEEKGEDGLQAMSPIDVQS